jgi:BolA protein
MNPTRTEKIQDLLTKALAPTQLSIINEDELHRGHVGSASGAGHFALTIASPQFEGKSLIQCHRLIYQALDEMLEHEIHALKINIIKPS